MNIRDREIAMQAIVDAIVKCFKPADQTLLGTPKTIEGPWDIVVFEPDDLLIDIPVSAIATLFSPGVEIWFIRPLADRNDIRFFGTILGRKAEVSILTRRS